jgi:hypothetical protein
MQAQVVPRHGSYDRGVSPRDPSTPPEGDDVAASGSARARNLVALGLLVVVVVGAVLFSRLGAEDDGAAAPPDPPASSPADRDALARAALDAQSAAVRRADAGAYRATWDSRFSASRRQARTTYANLTGLGVRRLDARYVSADVGAVAPRTGARLGAGAWTAEVEVTWKVSGVDRSEATLDLTYTFVQRGAAVSVVRIGQRDDGRSPIWLGPRLAVRRSDDYLAAAVGRREVDRLARLTRTASNDLHHALPQWDGVLVAYLPASDRAMEDLLGAREGSYDGIAAVTATLDGSARAPARIVVNPAVFDSLGPIGARVVVTHEATHLATGVTTVDLPLWVAEGFADHVAITAVDVPVDVSARAAIRQVRRQGPPANLPSNTGFAAGHRRLETAYELSWLAFRYMSEQYGEARTRRFYFQVVHRPDDLAGAFGTLGTTEGAFTQAWRAYVAGLADAR